MRRTKKIYVVVALAICALMILGLLSTALIGVVYGGSTTRQQIEELQSDLNSLASQKKAAKEKIAALQNDINQALEEKQLLDEQIDLTEQQIDAYDKLLVQLDEELSQKQQAVADAEQKAQEQYELLRMRIRASYEAGTISYLDVLFASDSYNSFLINMDIVSSILQQDQKVLDNLKQALTQCEEAKQEVEDVIAQQQAAKDDLEQTKVELETQQAQAQDLVSSLTEQKNKSAAVYQKYIAAEAAMKKELTDLQKQLSSAEYVGGVLTWPVPGYSTISCPYGMRTHPITGVYKMHTGVDIAAPYGAAVVAANTGTIITAGYNSAYGNYIVIDHGGQVTTMYAHLSKILVSKGQKVGKGDKIGQVGSTGLSTGNHLHFEVSKSGKTINPMSEFTLVGG